jgi:hypothetical protein
VARVQCRAMVARAQLRVMVADDRATAVEAVAIQHRVATVAAEAPRMVEDLPTPAAVAADMGGKAALSSSSA